MPHFKSRYRRRPKPARRKMKVENASDKLLSNYEVWEHINDIKHRRKKAAAKRKASQKTENLETILLEGYLKGSPVVKQTPDSIREFLQEMSIYKLEKAEKLMIINISPVSLVALYTLIEECETRFTEDECKHMLRLVENYLLRK